MEIRDLQFDRDIAVLVQMERQLFGQEAWERSDFAYFFRQGGQFRVGVQDGRIVGYSMFQVEYDAFHICNISVIPEVEGTGLGHQLLQDMLDAARVVNKTRVVLEVARSNERAIRFYLRHGFTQFGVRRRYYHNGDDALLMELHV